MKEGKSRPFNKRTFAAIMVALTGIGLPISGLANHFYQFDPMTLARHSWMAVHNMLSLLFLAFASWHIFMNRHAMLNHVKGFASEHLRPSREVLIAFAIVAVVMLVAVAHAFHAS